MNEQPSNIDKNRLMAMLGGAKAVMNKVEGNDYERGNVNENQITANPDKLLKELPEGHTPPSTYVPNPNGIEQTHKNLHTTKMSPAIVKAMMENPMPQQSMGGTFDLSDVAELVGKQPIINTPVNEAVYTPIKTGEKMITISESQLDAKIKDALLSFMTETFTKTLTENTIKKTITTLIKEGKIKVRAKK